MLCYDLIEVNSTLCNLWSDFFSRLKPSREGRIYRWEMICLGEIFNWLIRLLFVLGDIENFVSASYLLSQKVNLRLLAALSGLQ